jgi:hypothetical protein
MHLFSADSIVNPESDSTHGCALPRDGLCSADPRITATAEPQVDGSGVRLGGAGAGHHFRVGDLRMPGFGSPLRTPLVVYGFTKVASMEELPPAVTVIVRCQGLSSSFSIETWWSPGAN